MTKPRPSAAGGNGVSARPVLRKNRPDYPTQGELRDDSPAADASCSSRWRRDVAGAMTFFLALNIAGPGATAAPPPAAQAVQQSAEDTPAPSRQKGTIVAPIFNHGEGRGATGCIVSSPPVFLSEEEAIQIIKEELAKHGIALAGPAEFKDIIVRLPLQDRYGIYEREKKSPGLAEPMPMKADAADADKRIAVQFVSRKDCHDLTADSLRMSTVSQYRPKELASAVSKAAAGQGESIVYLGVFYDPMPRLSYWSEKERAALDDALAKLKAAKKNAAALNEKNASKTETERVNKKADGKKAHDDVVAKRDVRETKNNAESKRTLTHDEWVADLDAKAKASSKDLLRQQVDDFAHWLEKQGVKIQDAEKKEPAKAT